MKFQVNFGEVNNRDRCPTITIATLSEKEKECFEYTNIYGLYQNESTQGHGIQVNNPKLEKPLMKMCDTIAQAVYDYKMEIGK